METVVECFGAVVLAGTQRKNPTNARGFAVGLDTLPHKEEFHDCSGKNGTDAPEALRDLGEKSAAQAKEKLETMTAAAEEATDLLKHSYATTVTGIQDYNTKVLEFTNANIKARLSRRQN